MKQAKLGVNGKKYQIGYESFPILRGLGEEIFIHRIRYDGIVFVGDTWTEATKKVKKYIRSSEGTG